MTLSDPVLSFAFIHTRIHTGANWVCLMYWNMERGRRYLCVLGVRRGGGLLLPCACWLSVVVLIIFSFFILLIFFSFPSLCLSIPDLFVYLCGIGLFLYIYLFIHIIVTSQNSEEETGIKERREMKTVKKIYRTTTRGKL